MIDFDAQSQFADAAAALMRSCAVATAQTMTASACRGLTLWSDMLRAPGPRPLRAKTPANPFEMLWGLSAGDWIPARGSAPSWNPYATMWSGSAYTATIGDWNSWSRACWPAWTPEPVAVQPAAAPPQAIYASFRTSGGHAVAQVIAPAAVARAAVATATSVFAPMQAMLDAWRSPRNA